MKEKHQFFENADASQKAQVAKQEAEKQNKNDSFWKELEASEDPFDNLGGLAQHIHDNIGSTGVYIGQLEPKLRKIADDADELAHLDIDNPEIIKFKFANSDHKDLIVGTNLKKGQGISHDVFKDEITTANEKIDLEKKTQGNICD